MGQCLSILSRDRRQSKVQSLEVKRNSGLRKENATTKMRKGAEKIKEETKLGAKENDEYCHPNVESDIEVNSVVSSVSEESFTLDKQDGEEETNILHEETKEGSVKGNEDNETIGNRVILVQPAEETFSFASRDNIASVHEPSLPNLSKVSSLITQEPTCVYRYQGLEGNCVGVVEEWDAEGLRCLTNTFVQPSGGGLMHHEQNMMEAENITKYAKYKKSGKVAHLAVKKQLFGDIGVSRETQPRNVSLGIQDDNLELDTKQGILTTNKVAVDPDKPEQETKVKMAAGQAENLLSSKEIKNEPYWTLREIPSWNKQPCLTYNPDKANVERQMKNIDSEMAALLKPDEKNVKTTSIAFTIREDKNRAQTPVGRAPQRLVMEKKPEVNQEKIKLKQKDAEKRRNENIAKRIQSARRRSKQIEIPADGQEQRDKTMEKIEAVIARRDEILNQRVQTAQKSFQRKTDLIKIREKEARKVKEQVFEKVREATARRDEIIDQRVQAAMKFCNHERKNTEEESQLEIHKTKELVFKKMEETTIRRNIILNQRVETVKKSSMSRCDVVKEREVEMVDAQEQDLKRKLKSSQHNRERMLRKTVRTQVELEKRRELVRKKLARMKREQEEEHLQFVELETYDVAEQSDDDDNAW